MRKEIFMVKKCFFVFLSAAILILSFILCRFVFFDLHGMKEWPVVLLVSGGLIIVITMFFKCRYIPLFTSVGYLLAFIVGAVFQTDYTAPTGERANSFWIIWTITYLCVIAAGVVTEVVKRKKLNKF